MTQIIRWLLNIIRGLGNDTQPNETLTPVNLPTYLTSLRADEIVRCVSAAEFKSGFDCHLLVCPTGSLMLTAPVIANGEKKFYQIQEPDGIPNRLPDFPKSCIYPNLTISRLAKVICIPGGVAISKDSRIIAETFTCYWDRRFHHALIKSSEGYKLKEQMSTPEYRAGKFFYLDFQHLSHYGHFIADVIPRLWAYYYLRDYLNISDVKIIISRKPDVFIKQVLELAGITEDNIEEIDQAIEVEELFVATKALQLQDYAAPMLQQVWNVIRLRAECNNTGPKRVYLSRSRHPQRALLNEIEIEGIFAANGFHIAHPEEIAFSDQVELLANADLIAGPSGSNLFTLAFQQKMRSAFIMTSPALIHITDSLLQAGRSCELRTYIGDLAKSHPSFNEHWVHSPWLITDVDDLRIAIEKWISDFS